MSELAGWMRLKKAAGIYDFSLPYLDNPSSDVIHVVDYEDPNRQCPVLQAFLIFGSNGRTGNLENNTQYHNMAATALYSMVVYPGVIDEITSNRRMNIGSFGATTFEVDTYHLRSFLETAVQKKFLDKQCAELTNPDPALAGEVGQLIGDMHAPEKDTFLSDNCLWLPESITAASDGVSLESLEQDKILSLLQKVYKERIDGNYVSPKKAKDANGNETKVFSSTFDLQERLKKDRNQDPSKGLNQWIDSKLQMTSLDEDTLAADLDAVLAAYGMDKANLVKTLDKAVLDQFAPEGKDVSLGRCILFAAQLKACFENYIDVLKTGIVLQGVQDPCNDVAEDVAKSLKDLVAKAYKEDNGLLGFGKKFNDKEIESIGSRFQYCMYAAIFLKLKPALIDFYQRAVAHLVEIADALKTMVAILKKTNFELDKNLATDFGKLTYDEIIGEFFIDAKDSDSVLKSIPQAASLKNVYYRQLKPIMSVGEINELLEDSRNVRLNKRPVLDEIGKQLRNLLAINDPTIKNKRFDSSDEAIKALPRELSKFISANVHLADSVGNETFMDAHFAFQKVLQNNIKCWNKLLEEFSSTQVANLKDRFRDFLGVDDEDYDEDGLLNKDNILKKMIFSLVNTCKPWIQVKPNSKLSSSLDCTVLLPQSVDDPDELAGAIGEISPNMSVNVKCPGRNENALNLPSDRIVVFNAEVLQDADFAPMDKIQNLTQWDKNSDINALLVLAEGPREGETAWFRFEDGRWTEKQRGMAYVSPIFENEELPLKDLRWHPWMKETPTSAEEKQREKAYRALFYGFLGTGVEGANVVNILAGYGCEHPLLKEAGQDFSFLYKKPRYWDGSVLKASTILQWEISSDKANRALHSINNVVEYLCGNGDITFRADGGQKFQASKVAGKNLCDTINTEADAFFANVFSKLGDADKRQLIEALYDWLNAQKKDSDKEDTPYWTDLLVFTVKESEELGVRLQ